MATADTTHDYVIVGAGSAGCVLANRLSADRQNRVLLLEAGPPDKKTEIGIPAAFPKLFKTEFDWDYETQDEPGMAGRRIYWPRGRTLGGSSSVNAMMYVRGTPDDYDQWAALGNPGWGWDDVLAYFCRLEDFDRGPAPLRGVGGPVEITSLRDPHPLTRVFLDAAAEVGLDRNDDVNGPVQDGVGLTQVNQHRGKRQSMAGAYLVPARRRPNLEVVTGAMATSIRLDGGRAVGVDYLLDGQARHAAAGAEVLVCGGAINSPHLLMLSGIGPADQLRGLGIDVAVDLPGVGENLQDHLMLAVLATTSGRPPTLFAAEKPAQLVRFLARRKGMLTSNIGEACGFVRTEDGLAAPDLEVIFAPVQFIDNGLAPPPCHGVTAGPVLLHPESRGRLSLRSADPSAKPVIEANYLSDPEGRDVRVLVEGVKLCRRILEADAFAGYGVEVTHPAPDVRDDAAIEAFARSRAHSLYHPVGTCSMGSNGQAVVGPDLAVHGVEGLRVVDASVMPRLIGGHTNAPTVMIAEKAADLIAA